MIRFLIRPMIRQFPSRIDFALVAGMKPPVAQNFCALLRTVPISRKNVRPPYYDLFVFGKLHLDARNRRTHAARRDVVRIVHGANCGRFRESVDLQHRDAEHHEVELGIYGERSRSADECFQLWPDHLFADGRKHAARAIVSQTLSTNWLSSRVGAPTRPFALP